MPAYDAGTLRTHLLLLASLLCACQRTGSQPHVSSPDLTAADSSAATDLASTAGDLSALGDQSAMADLAGDLSTLPDLSSPDLDTSIALAFSVTVTNAFEDCQPPAPSDPLHVTLVLKALNASTHNIGPFVAKIGGVLDSNGSYIAGFSTQPIGPFSLLPGEVKQFSTTNIPGTLSPALGCSTIPCSSSVSYYLYVEEDGALVAKPVAAAMSMQCVF